jgi:hypothetical protein
LVNADIILPDGADLSGAVAALCPGQFLFSRRIDVDIPFQTEGTPYPYGYDFFAGHADDLAGLPDAGMVFGAPWWDHFFPIIMFMRGCPIRQHEPVVFHLAHKEQWDLAVYRTIGQRFVAEIRPNITNNYYGTQIGKAVSGMTGRLLPDLKHRVWRRLPQNAVAEANRKLWRVSDANLRFLDEMGPIEGVTVNSEDGQSHPAAQQREGWPSAPACGGIIRHPPGSVSKANAEPAMTM